MIISAAQALVIAQRAFASALQYDHSSMISPWREGLLADPLLVRTVELNASYWIVPVQRAGQVLGTIDIGPDGRIMGSTYLYQNPADLSVCPPLATRISANEAQELAGDLLKQHDGAGFSDPVFVHDGSHNRLAWMIEVRVVDELISRVFVTPGYAYEKKVGGEFPPSGLRGRPA